MKKKGLLRSIATFSSLTFLSRVLGLVRDVVVGAVFGPGAATDAFFVALKIPNFMRRLFAEGAFSQAFVPVLSEYREVRSHDEVRRLIGAAAGVLGVVLLLVTGLGIVFAPAVISVFAPGFLDDPGKFELAVTMLRWTFSYILFISLAACAGGVLNTYGRFGPPAFAPVLLNLCLIGAALWAAPHFEAPIVALAVAVFVAGILQLALQLPYLAQLKLLCWPRPAWSEPGVQRILRLMAPAVFGSSVAQINIMVGTVLASFLVTGSVSWLYYSDRLVEFPIGIFAVALGTVILPKLSREHASASSEQFTQTLDWALRLVVLISIPATVGLVMLAVPLMATIFMHGSFSERDVIAASLSLSTYSLGLIGLMLVKVALPGYFARQDTRTPVRFAVVAAVANMILATLAVVTLKDTGYGHAAVAGAWGFTQVLNAVMLMRGLRAQNVYRPQPGWGRLALQIALASVAMALVLLWPAMQRDFWLESSALTRAGALAAVIGAAAIVYFGLLFGSGLRPRELRAPKEVAPRQ